MVIEPPQFQNFTFPRTWLLYAIVSKYSCPCYGFLTPQFQNFTNPPHGIFSDCYSHIVSIKTPPSASHHLPPPTKFSPGLFVVLQEIICQPCIALIRLFAKNDVFKVKQTFSSKLIADWVWFCFVYMCFYGVFYNSLMVKVGINNLFCIASNLVSYQIMQHNKRIDVLRTTSCCCFFGFWGY